MDQIASSAALLLAIVFAWSAVAKFRSPDATRQLLDTLDVPFPRMAGRALPLIEVALAVGLLVFQRPAAVAAIVVLIVFSLVLASIIRRGVEIECGCFGSSSTEPVSVIDLVRNGGLVALGAVAVVGPSFVQPSVPSLIVASMGGLLVLIAMSLVGLHRSTGSVFGIELAGEVGRMSGSR